MGVNDRGVRLSFGRCVGAVVEVTADFFLGRTKAVAVFTAQLRVFHYGFHEIAEYGQGGAAALAERSGTEVYATVFSAYPSSAYKVRRYAHKPGIGVVV